LSTTLPFEPRTLPAALRRAAERFPRRGVALFDRRGEKAERRTYPELLATARRGAARLYARGVRPRDPVLVCLPTSWEWFETWFGALLVGAWPVAVAPGGALGASEAQVDKVEHLIERLGARLLVASPSFFTDAGRHGASFAPGLAATPEELAATTVSAAAPEPGADLDDVAYLQLTSGSTGFPRGVVVTHRNALHNNWACDVAIGTPRGGPASTWADAMVSWLPLYHDMGLVGCVLLPIFAGWDLWLFSPRSFLARPAVWMRHLGGHGRTITAAPNFGYQLCTERVSAEERAGLELGDFHAAMIGAEMIRPESMADFLTAFAPQGLERAALRPCYGLAEGTLAVTFDLRGEGVRTRRAPAEAGAGEVVCVGRAVEDTEVRIAAPSGEALAEGRVGDVLVRGPGVFGGYFNDPESTAEGLRDGWLATSDLGFLAGGELYITGRTKDLLIVRGQNLMPHELEWVADAVVAGGGSLRSGAFSIARGAHGEEAVLVLETTDREPAALAALEHEVRVRIGRTVGLPLADVAFVPRGKIPKTTSGKVQRQELRRRYLAGELERLPVPPHDPIPGRDDP